MSVTSKVPGYDIRRWYVQEQEILTNETYRDDAAGALRKIVVAAVIRNPYAGRFSEDLSGIVDGSDALGVAFAAPSGQGARRRGGGELWQGLRRGSGG